MSMVIRDALPGEDGQDPLFANGGELGRVMAGWNWAATPVGPPDTWPAELRSVVRILLTSRFSMWMAWGPELSFFYNDAYRRDTLREKHPRALGQPARLVWAEIWDDIGPRIRSVLDTGEATWDEGLQLFLERSGYPEETYHTFSYSPLGDVAGQVQGMLCVVTETTERVLSERRLRILSELGDIAAVTAPTVDDACRAALAVLTRGRFDVPLAAIYLADPGGRTARRAGFYGVLDDPRIVPVELDRSADAALWRALSGDGPQVTAGMSAACAESFVFFGDQPGSPWNAAVPDTIVALPLAGAGRGEPVGVLLAGVSPFRALDVEYRRFLDLAARQVATALADAEAYQFQRRRADQLAALDRAKTEFFTGVSHELRTPLTLIAGPAADILTDDVHPLHPVQRDRVEMIARNSGRLRRLVDTILDFARLEGGRLTAERDPVDLAALTRGIAESFAPAVVRAGLGFTVGCPALPSAVAVDVVMWEKIVLNLLSNAVKYTLGGHVGLALTAGSTTHGPGVCLTVTDTGIGIPADELPHLFQRFHRVRGARGRSDEGSGIGLALVAELTALHDGTVEVESTPGHGSTFRVNLPPSALTGAAPGGASTSGTVQLYREEALQWSGREETALDAGLPIDAGTTAGARVLVAEDNPDLRRFLADLLGGQYTVLLAADGPTALRKAREMAPDLVLTDVMMPGLDGFGLLAALRGHPATSTIPVIMLSARAGEEASAEGLDAGADDYLTKPFASHDLLARVRSNLQMARLRNDEATWRTTMIDALQDGFLVLDEGSAAIIEINTAMTDLLGLRSRDLPCAPPYPFFPTEAEDPDDLAFLHDAFAAALSAGSGQVAVPLRHITTRARVWASVTYSSLRNREGRRVFITTMRDITAERRTARRDALLAATGRLFAETADLRDRLTRFARLAAGETAGMVLISLIGPDGRLAPAAAAHRTLPALADDVMGLQPFRIDDRFVDAYLGGRAFVLAPGDAEHLDGYEAARDIGVRHAVAGRDTLVAPLTVAGRILGSLSITSVSPADDPDDDMVALAEELGRRVAGAVEADRVAARERQLHEITGALASAATLVEAAAALTDGVTRILGAAGAAVFTVDPDQQQISAVHSVDRPGDVADPQAVRTSAHRPAGDAARTGRPVWIRDRATWLAQYPDAALTTTDTGSEAAAVLPLLSGGRVIGVVAATFTTPRTFPPDEREFALTIAGQAAQAFERAGLADQRWELAQTLQRALLPPALPQLPGLGLAARYVPAVAGTAAGGDWFDVFAVDATRVALSVGDVVGQGPAAAAVMGQLRGVLSSALLQGNPPAASLEVLDQFVARVPGAPGSTALCAILDVRTGALCWSAAGHLPPTITGPGGARHLQGGEGTLLGVRGRAAFAETGDVLAPGESVVLYTDGLVERRGAVVDDGLDRVGDTATALQHLPPDELAEALLQQALGATGHADDIAVVIARLVPTPLHGRLPAVPACLSGLRRDVAAWASAAGLPDLAVEDLQLALSEVASNAVEHAYHGSEPGEFAFHVERDAGGTVRVEVQDFGRWRPPPADRGYRGRGLALVRTLARQVVLEQSASGTRIAFEIPALPADGTSEVHLPEP